jgi:hypothetical protein
MLTPELVKEALQTSHDACDEPNGCVHAEALSGAAEEFKMAVAALAIAAMAAPNPLEAVVVNAIHIGYRMRELEEAADKGETKKVLVN